jgi:phosphatidylglycerol:prolipoprotein diacylglycerol transferase
MKVDTSNNFYALFLGISWGIGFMFFCSFTKKISIQSFFIFIFIFINSWIFSKLFFILEALYNQIPLKLLLKIDLLWGGGFVFFGGLIGGLISLALVNSLEFKERLNLSFNDFILPVVLCHGIGRLGCFFAGCCFGTLTELPWGVEYDGASKVHPTQLYEILMLICIYFLLKFLNRFNYKFSQFKVSFYLVTYSVGRFFLEFIRGDHSDNQLFYLSFSQMVSIIILMTLFVVHLLSFLKVLHRHKVQT